MIYLNNFSCLFLIVLLSACSFSNELKTNLNSKKQSLSYLHDSQPVFEKKNINIKIDSVSIRSNAMNVFTTVVKNNEGSYFYPLVFIYFWNNMYHCDLGKEAFSADISNFLLKSFEMEAYRSASYIVNSKEPISGSEYQLDLIIDSLSISGPYQEEGKLFISPWGYIESHTHLAGPSQTFCKLQFKLSSNGQPVFSKDIRSAFTTQTLSLVTDKGFKIYQQSFATSMAEGLSQSIKDAITETVNEINTYVLNQEQNLITIKELSKEEFIQNTENYEQIKILSPGHSYFCIDDGRTFEGSLCKVSKKEISIANDRILITINRSKLVKIEDNQHQDITERELSRKDFKRINYNYYLEFVKIN